MRLCSCLASCLAWHVQHCSLLVVEWSWVLVLRWRSLGELSLIDIMWGQEVSGGPVSWTQLSHFRGWGLTPGWSIKTLSATWLECLDSRRSWPAVSLLRCTLESPVSSLFCPKGSVPQKNSSLENSHSSKTAFFFPLCLVGFHLLTGAHVQRPCTRLFWPEFLVRSGYCQHLSSGGSCAWVWCLFKTFFFRFFSDFLHDYWSFWIFCFFLS